LVSKSAVSSISTAPPASQANDGGGAKDAKDLGPERARFVGEALALLPFLQWTVEMYGLRRSGRFSRSHPTSSVRYVLHMRYLSKFEGWEEGATTAQSDSMTETLQALQRALGLGPTRVGTS
jgi:hypothetical protein